MKALVELVKLREGIEAAQSDRDEMKALVDLLVEERTLLQEEKEKLSGEKETLETNTKALREEIDALNANISRLEGEARNAKEQLEAARCTITGQEDALDGMRSVNDESAAKLAEQDGMIQKSVDLTMSLQKKVQRLEEEKESADALITMLANKVEEIVEEQKNTREEAGTREAALKSAEMGEISKPEKDGADMATHAANAMEDMGTAPPPPPPPPSVQESTTEDWGQQEQEELAYNDHSQQYIEDREMGSDSTSDESSVIDLDEDDVNEETMEKAQVENEMKIDDSALSEEDEQSHVTVNTSIDSNSTGGATDLLIDTDAKESLSSSSSSFEEAAGSFDDEENELCTSCSEGEGSSGNSSFEKIEGEPELPALPDEHMGVSKDIKAKVDEPPLPPPKLPHLMQPRRGNTSFVPPKRKVAFRGMRKIFAKVTGVHGLFTTPSRKPPKKTS
mmetsp:Transcript_3606/g.5451  ORF Transcript_3606/g.5451 Transcript_3606/m.5451 type:complete len:450 (+) Transcript_3606:3-1352(+)